MPDGLDSATTQALLLRYAISEPGMLCSVRDAFSRVLYGLGRDPDVTVEVVGALNDRGIRRGFEALVRRGLAARCRRESPQGRMTRHGVIYERLASPVGP